VGVLATLSLRPPRLLKSGHSEGSRPALSTGDRPHYGRHLDLAQQVGGIPMTFRGQDVASTILAFAREYAIKIIVVGKSRQPWYPGILTVSF